LTKPTLERERERERDDDAGILELFGDVYIRIPDFWQMNTLPYLSIVRNRTRV